MNNIIEIILGQKGSGKTTLARILFKKLDRVVSCDPMNQFFGGNIFYSFPEFVSQFNQLYEIGKFKVICKFTRDEDYSNLFDFLFDYYNYTLIIDEIDKFASSYNIEPGLKRIISYGRNHSINLIGVSRRPYEINRTLSAGVDIIYSFRQTELRDLEYMEKNFGIPPDKLKTLIKINYPELPTENLHYIKIENN